MVVVESCFLLETYMYPYGKTMQRLDHLGKAAKNGPKTLLINLKSCKTCVNIPKPKNSVNKFLLV